MSDRLAYWIDESSIRWKDIGKSVTGLSALQTKTQYSWTCKMGWGLAGFYFSGCVTNIQQCSRHIGCAYIYRWIIGFLQRPFINWTSRTIFGYWRYVTGTQSYAGYSQLELSGRFAFKLIAEPCFLNESCCCTFTRTAIKGETVARRNVFLFRFVNF